MSSLKPVGRASALLPGLLAAVALAPALARAEDAPAGPAVSGNARLEDVQKRIRDAVIPEDERRACLSPTGSYEEGEQITVCGDAIGLSRYRVPREVAVASKEEDLKTPVQRGREIMNAGNGPVGNSGDLGKAAGNPLLLGYYAYKFLEKTIEDAKEE